MTSPRDTGAGSNPFVTTDPFANDGHRPSEQAESSAESSSADAHGKSDTDSKAESEHKATNNVHWGVAPGEASGSGNEDLLEKTDTAELNRPIVDKIREAVSDRFHLQSIRATAPSRIFNPTTVKANIRWKDSDGTGSSIDRPDLNLVWRSRDNRKGRNSSVVPTPSLSQKSTTSFYESVPAWKASLKQVGKNIVNMFCTFPYYDMAFWSGWSYTIGSALFVIDGAFAWTIVAYPDTEFAGEDTYGVPLCFFFGAIFYQIGAVMAYLEAVNDGSFHGSAMRRFLQGHEDVQKQMLDEKIHHFFGHFVPHRHKNEEKDLEKSVDPEAGWKTMNRRERPGSIYQKGKGPAPRRGGVDHGEVEEGETTTYFTWRWWPSWHMLRTHHVYEIGYMACAIQLFGVTLYGVTAIVVLPGILDTLNVWETNAAYWIPQMVAAAGFLIPSVMFMLETQEKWWKPEPKVIGWWVGVWSLIGSVGFELAAAFGPTSNYHTWAEYQADLSSMWGSAAYLIGSFLQWYEAVNKNPIAEIFNEPGEMKSYQVRV